MFSFFILTVCLIRIVSMGLAVLFKNISRKNPPSTTELAELLTEWKKHYLLICDLVLDLNEFIGVPLLIFLTKAFISFVGYSFYILVLLISPKRDLFAIFHILSMILKNLICVVILAFASEKISSEVRWNVTNSIPTHWFLKIRFAMHLDFQVCQSTETCPSLKLRHQKRGEHLGNEKLYETRCSYESTLDVWIVELFHSWHDHESSPDICGRTHQCWFQLDPDGKLLFAVETNVKLEMKYILDRSWPAPRWRT